MSWFLDHRPLWAVLISMVAAVFILGSGRRPNLRETWTFLAAFLKFGIILSLIPEVLDGKTIESGVLALTPTLLLHLRVDPAGLFFALLASLLWLITSVYSVGYMRANRYKHQTGYYACFAVCLSATIGIAFAANLLTFFVFYEILTVATYPLVIHHRTPEALLAGRKYLAYTLIAGQFLLIAVAWTHIIAPGQEFQPGGFLTGVASQKTLTVLFVLFLFGWGVKAAIMPLHGWLPAAMVAPTPVSALLHAVAVVKSGVFGCVRICGFVFGTDLMRELGVALLLACLAAITILLASFRALGEDHLKRRLAYSTISQLSYIVLGMALGSAAAVAGALFHIAAHGVMKITLFFCAGAIHTKSHKTFIHELSGIGRKMPITMGAFTLGAVGLAGTPLLAGFITKWNIGLGSIDAGYPIFIAVLAGSALLNIAYFFPIIYAAFFGNPSSEKTRLEETRPALYLPLALTGVIALVLGVFPNIGLSFYELAWAAAQSMVPG